MRAEVEAENLADLNRVERARDQLEFYQSEGFSRKLETRPSI